MLKMALRSRLSLQARVPTRQLTWYISANSLYTNTAQLLRDMPHSPTRETYRSLGNTLERKTLLIGCGAVKQERVLDCDQTECGHTKVNERCGMYPATLVDCLEYGSLLLLCWCFLCDECEIHVS